MTEQFADIFVTITDKDGKVLGQRNIFQYGIDTELADEVLKDLEKSFNVFTEFDEEFQEPANSDWIADVPY